MYVNLDKETSNDFQKEELIHFSEVEDVFLKKYEILAFSQLNVGMTLSIKGTDTGMIIRYNFINGNLIPSTIKYDGLCNERIVTEEDSELIREISKYGTTQQFSHYLLSKSVVSK